MMNDTDSTVAAAKKHLRHIMEARRQSLPQDVRFLKSRFIIERLKKEKFFKDAKTVMLYASLPHEVQLFELIDECQKNNMTLQAEGIKSVWVTR